MARNFFFLFLGALLAIVLLFCLIEDKRDLSDRVVASYPNARFMSQVDVPGGVSAVFLCEEGTRKMIVVVGNRAFRSSVSHTNDNFQCK